MSADNEMLLAVRDLRVTARGRHRQSRTIVDGVDLAIGPGEAVAVVGESGSGKSMTARAIMGLLPPKVSASGTVCLSGVDLLGLSERRLQSIRGRGIGLVMQDPFTMLNPVMRCGDIVAESLRGDARKGSRASRMAFARDRLAEVGIEDPTVVKRFPFQLSGGMQQRVAIATSLALQPALLIADEPTTALDVTTQKEVLDLLTKARRQRSMSLMLITHDLSVAFATCDRIYVMYAGSLMEVGPASQIQSDPAHPYTSALLMAEPPIDHRARELISIGGSVPRADDVAQQCPFAARCDWAVDLCRAQKPQLRADPSVSPVPRSVESLVSCWRQPEIADALRSLRDARPGIASTPPVSVGDVVLDVIDARKSFGAGRSRVDSLRGVTLQVREDECVGIVGESGSGKTTLSRCVVALESLTGGEIRVRGRTMNRPGMRLRRHDRLALARAVQFVFQDPYSSLNPARTIGAILDEALTRATNPQWSGDVSGLLSKVGLPAQYALRLPSALSGGERQRVAIARALAPMPKLIVCDEPVSAVDVSVQAQILTLLRDLRSESGISLLFVSHDLAVVRQIADRVHVMNRGEVVEHGPISLIDSPSHPYTVKLVESVISGAAPTAVAADPASPTTEGHR